MSFDYNKRLLNEITARANEEGLKRVHTKTLRRWQGSVAQMILQIKRLKRINRRLLKRLKRIQEE